ncbi:response regulator transcription factor [Jatrophihabitans sp.]|uniref:response regulator transcription factor n=1 Tax=Jatrophihabitans sp. TaxID=1932789 RepID=UPI0030C676A5|nr:DNA-binding response regulator [Jatrophihabitans sp.]
MTQVEPTRERVVVQARFVERRTGRTDRRRPAWERPGAVAARPTTVGIADQRPMLCDSLAEFLSREESLHFVGSVSSVTRIATFVRTYRPDVLVLDAEIDGARGLDVLATLHAMPFTPSVVMLTPEHDHEATSEAIRMGACGVVPTIASFLELVDAIHWTAQGKAWLSRAQLTDLLTEQHGPSDSNKAKLETLTKREVQILTLLVDGLGHAAIADRLYLSANTVRTHSQNLQKKLGVHSAIAAVALALDSGLRPT